MAKYLRYYGEFASIGGHAVRVELLQEAAQAYTPQEIFFPADKPLEIEWSETDKIEPMQASFATLRVLSDTDRRFLDLHTCAYGDVRLDVYRDGELYWSGVIDNESYEEPYSTLENYDVSLTFSDFGYLKRLKYDRTGQDTFGTILNYCIAKMEINTSDIPMQHISTTQPEGILMSLILVNDNFYDEDGKAMTVYEVLQGILQPFALRIIQRSGRLFIYDLNDVYSLVKQNVVWAGEDAVLSVDKIYNNAKVTFSPYSSDVVIDAKAEVKTTGSADTRVMMRYSDASASEGFDVYHTNISGKGLTLANGAMYCKIVSLYSGQDAECILWGYKKGDNPISEGFTQIGSPAISTLSGSGGLKTIIKAPKLSYINKIRSDYKQQYRLRINLDLLFDAKYNPFEDSTTLNEKDNYELMVNKCRFLYVPVNVTLRDSSGTAICHLKNYELVSSESMPSDALRTRWVAGEAQPGDFYLAWYDTNDRRKSCGVGGWQTNKQSIGHFFGSLPEIWSKMDDGEYVELPDYNGYIDFEVLSGVGIHDGTMSDWSVLQKIRWVAYKDLSITLVDKYGKAVELQDQEDTAYLNTTSEEEMTVETILGTLDDKLCIQGKGVLMAGTMHTVFLRASHLDRLERLLLGTIYSQYATRKPVISGTAELIDGFMILGDVNTSGKFLLASDVQNLRADESQIKMVEFIDDIYDGIEYE